MKRPDPMSSRPVSCGTNLKSLQSLTRSRGPERDHLTGSGRDVHEVFDTPIGKVGMLICWDLAFPEAFRELIANGAKIM
jgi:predicted amidohydrolase